MSAYYGTARDYFRKELLNAKYGISKIFETVGRRTEENPTSIVNDSASQKASIIKGQIAIGRSLCEHFTDLQEQILQEYNKNIDMQDYDMLKGIPYLFMYIKPLAQQIQEIIRRIPDFCNEKIKLIILIHIDILIKDYIRYLTIRNKYEYYRLETLMAKSITEQFDDGDASYCEFVRYKMSGKLFPTVIDFKEEYEITERGYYYRVLGLPPGSSQKEVTNAFRKLAVVYHPDKSHTTPYKGNNRKYMWKVVNEAYAILGLEKNTDKKHQYDNDGNEENWIKDVKGAFKNNCYDFGEYNPYKVIQ